VLVAFSAFITAALISVLIFGGLMLHFRTLDCNDQVSDIRAKPFHIVLIILISQVADTVDTTNMEVMKPTSD
jgi:hypothetical protein